VELILSMIRDAGKGGKEPKKFAAAMVYGLVTNVPKE